MKIIYTFLLSCISCMTSAQLMPEYLYNLNFDDDSGLAHLAMDLQSNPSNSWQIGSPQKSTLNQSLSVPNVIITDTINAYPVNDTSYFTITNIAGAGFYYQHTAAFSGYYWVDSDSLTDQGTIEFSPDNGQTWVDLMANTSSWSSEVPTLTGNSSGWKFFRCDYLALGLQLGVQMGDTIQVRFGFLSDSYDSGKAGLMYDSFIFEDWVEGIEENSTNFVRVFPVPASDKITVKSTEDLEITEVQLLDMQGKKVLLPDVLSGDLLDVSSIANGMYYLKIVSNRLFDIERIVINH